MKVNVQPEEETSRGPKQLLLFQSKRYKMYKSVSVFILGLVFLPII